MIDTFVIKSAIILSETFEGFVSVRKDVMIFRTGFIDSSKKDLFG
jgi:hypothetical protein